MATHSYDMQFGPIIRLRLIPAMQGQGRLAIPLGITAEARPRHP
jgi:hypothetical protein